MELSNFERNQILKYLNAYARKINQEPLDFFQKAQVFDFLNKRDKSANPKLGKEPQEPEKEIIVKKEIIQQEISDDKMKEIISAVRAEIQVKDGSNGKDGKDAPEMHDILDALKQDYEFIQQLKAHVPKWTGTGGYGRKDILKLIEENAIPLNPKYFGPEFDDGNWRIRQDGEHLRFEYLDDGVWMEQGEVFVSNRAIDGMLLTEDNNPITTEDENILIEE